MRLKMSEVLGLAERDYDEIILHENCKLGKHVCTSPTLNLNQITVDIIDVTDEALFDLGAYLGRPGYGVDIIFAVKKLED